MSDGTSRSDEDLRIAAGHLDYEYGEILRNDKRIHEDPAFLEAYLVHVRALTEFLIGRDRRHPNDITPEDFAAGWSPPNSDAVERLRFWLPEIDRHLAHVTWTRVDWMKADP